jgi:hypothetical protein
MKLRIASLSLLTIVCLALAVAPAMADTLYNNGPYNGTADGWTFNFGFSVSDSFTTAANSQIQDLHIVYWDASATDQLTTLDMALGSTSFGGTPQTLTGVTNLPGNQPVRLQPVPGRLLVREHSVGGRGLYDPEQCVHHFRLLCHHPDLLG